MSKKPNILFIMADQFRADALACVGGYGRTTALDQLAAEGVLFARAITNSPQCIPARFALATGLYPHQTNVWRNGVQTLAPDAPNWTRALAEGGYRTSLFGKTHFHESAHESRDLRDGLELMRQYGLMDVDEIGGPWASQHVISNMTERWHQAGVFDAFREDVAARKHGMEHLAAPSPLGLEQYYDTYVGQAAARYLAAYERAEPWFCWVSFSGPHAPWDAPAPYDTMHDPRAAPLPIPPYGDGEPVDGLIGAKVHAAAKAPISNADIAALRANYAGNVTLIDDQIAKILDVVRRRGEYDDTLIVFTADHGEMNGDHGLLYKSNFLAPALDIPLIVRPPGGMRRPKRSEVLVGLIDVGPTICDYAGCAPPPESRGISLRRVVENRTARHRKYLMSEFNHNTMIFDGRWKVEFGAKGVLKLLFDTKRDPQERHNLALLEVYAGEVERLRKVWQELLAKTSRSFHINASASASASMSASESVSAGAEAED